MPVYGDKLCFFHVQKTGGTWVRQAAKAAGIPLHPLGDDNEPVTHLPHAESKPEWYTDKLCFTFVRDPFTWLRSWFCSREKEQWTEMQGPSQKLHEIRADTFPAFIGNYLAKLPGEVGRIFSEYTDGCQYVGRTEDQPEPLIAVLRLAGYDFDPKLIRGMKKVNPAIPEIMAKAVCSPVLMHAVYAAEAEYCEKYEYPMAAPATGSGTAA